jgi:hypothetical protein
VKESHAALTLLIFKTEQAIKLKRRIFMVNRKEKSKKYKNSAVDFTRYIVTWRDIVSDSSWQTMDDATNQKTAIVKSLCHILKKTKTDTITFADYSIDNDDDTNVEIANTNIIPNSVIISVEKTK